MGENVIVRVAQGLLRGRKLHAKHSWYNSFQGIPYAKPPVGLRRFQPPQMVDAWTGVRDAVIEGSKCPQIDVLSEEFVGEEDSLFLNVYSPQTTPETLKPVMVWIHGGGFIDGSGNSDLYGPDYLVDAGVVLVTINYRLGALGFLYVEGTDASGNNGMKDQVMALQWVKANISQFGGDPENITLFGESAGGASVHYHLLSPMSAGLFHRGIAQSGCALNPWSYMQPSDERAYRLAQLLGCETTEPQKLVDFLRSVPFKKIVEKQRKTLTKEEVGTGIELPFVPTVESGSSGVFLPHPPAEMIRRGMVYDVPLITGVNTCEGLVILKAIAHKLSAGLSKVDQHFERTVPTDLALKQNLPAVSEKIKKFYFGERAVCEETLSQYVDYLSDTTFTYGVYNTVQKHLSVVKSPIYFYQFDFDGRLGWLKNVMGVDGLKGTCHADELGYIFRSTVFGEECGPDSMEAKVVGRMVKMWTNFAKTGNPSLDPEVQWKPVTTRDFTCLCIDDNLSQCVYPEMQRMKFWEELYKDNNISKL